MKNYIKTQKNKENYYTINGIEISIKDPIPPHIDLKSTIGKALTIMPRHLFKSIKKITIGQFQVLNDRELDALYKDKVIYLTNLQDSSADILDDIVHEIAHSVEVEYEDLIYADGELQAEFLEKRRKLKYSLDNLGFFMPLDKYTETRYDREFDMFLYKEVGYPTLAPVTAPIFLSPYAATSLREYFAVGFENLFLNQDSYQILRRKSPNLFKRLVNLLSLEEEK